MYRWYLCLLGLLLSACAEDVQPAPKHQIVEAQQTVLLYQEPSPQSRVLGALAEGTPIPITGRVAPQLTAILRNGREEWHPWVRIEQTAHGAAWVQWLPDQLLPTPLVTAQRDSLLVRAVLGKSYAKFYEYHARFKQFTGTSDEWLTLYREGGAWRDQWQAAAPSDTVTQLLQRLGGLPGFHRDRVGWWTDWRQWKQLAERTSSPADNQLVELQLKVAGSDSIEYRFPAWYLTDGDRQHSLFGSGLHYDLLQQMVAVEQFGPAYREEVQGLRATLLRDILLPTQTYWFDSATILAEVDQILENTESLHLSAADRLALELRHDQFMQADRSNVQKLNFRAGRLE